jgi:hypothetical protein
MSAIFRVKTAEKKKKKRIYFGMKLLDMDEEQWQVRKKRLN